MPGLTERERELRTQRKTLWEANVPLVEKVGRGESLTAEERTAYDQRDAEITKVGDDLTDVIRMREAEKAAGEHNEAEAESRGISTTEVDDRERREWSAFSRWFAGGEQALSNEDRAVLTPHIKGVPLPEARSEQRTGPGGDVSPMQLSPLSVSVTGGSQGGYLVPPGFWHRLQIALKAFGGAYSLFEQVNTATGEPMDWATTDPTGIVAYQLAENTVVTPQDVSFGLGQLNAWTYVAGPFLASLQILNDSAFDLDTFLRDRIGMAIGRAQAAAAWSGTGSGQPLGMTAALIAKGAGTVGSGAGGVLLESSAVVPVTTFGNVGTPLASEVLAGAISFSTAYDLITLVDPAYRQLGGCRWVMNDRTLQAERKITDSMGRPLIDQSVNMGGTDLGDTLAGYPVTIDNNAPTITGVAHASVAVAGVSGPVFGRFESAMVARNVTQAGVMVLRERYADFLSVGWLGFMRYDIRSNDMRAIASVSYASS